MRAYDVRTYVRVLYDMRAAYRYGAQILQSILDLVHAAGKTDRSEYIRARLVRSGQFCQQRVRDLECFADLRAVPVKPHPITNSLRK